MRSALLIGVLLLIYCIPLVWWALQYLIRKELVVPPEFPFTTIMTRTVVTSSVVALCALLAAYPVVVLWRLSSTLLRATLTVLVIIPLITGLVARNYSWIGLLSGKDTFGHTMLYSWGLVFLVMTSIFVPVAFFVLAQGARAITPETLDAARVLGLSDGKIVLFVVVPQTFRAALLASGLIFVMAVGFFITPKMLGGGKVEFISNGILMFLGLGDFETASALTLRFLAAIALPTIAITLLALRKRRLVTGR